MITVTPDSLAPYVRVVSRHPVAALQRWQRNIADLQLIYVSQGTLQLKQDKATHRATVGHVLLLLPGIPHDLLALEQGHISTVHFEGIRQHTYANGDYRFSPDIAPCTPCENKPLVENLFDSLWTSFNDYGPQQPLVLSHLVGAILATLMQGNEETSHTRHTQHPRMINLLAYIRDNLHGHLDRNVLADSLGVTPQHVNYLIKNHFGVNASALIHRERAIAAHRLLTQGASIAEAGHAVGYKDPYTFSRQFKRHMGMAPRYALIPLKDI